MRNFFASFFGTLAALAVVFASIATGLALLVGSATARREPTVSFTPGSWLVLDLADDIQDAPIHEDGFDRLTQLFEEDGVQMLQGRQVTRALEAAANDPEIAGLYISGQEEAAGGTAGFAALKEVRDAVAAFRASGKPVKAWLSFAGTREYYIASAADEIVLDPFGAILVPGLATQPVFFANAFEKFGVGVQVTRVGKYKSAVEPYTRSNMSPESRAQTQKLLDDIWVELTTSIESARKLEPRALQRTADADGLVMAKAALAARLVDRVAYVDEVLEELRAATSARSPQESFRQVALSDYARLVPGTNLVARRRESPGTTPTAHEKLAIVYAEGPIVDGSGADRSVVWGDKIARQLREIRRDDSVKALVLRVNSPGGSVTASEAIGREVRLIQAKKPVVVSMGSYAASGGYWISTYSDRIFAEPTTITGSIGVFGLLFNVEGLATDRLGLNFETVKTARFADAATITRPKTPEELAIVQSSVDWIYDQFVSKVAESRRLDATSVREIAQGRVWSGSEAAKIGLVDEIGGLAAAVRFAAEKASVGEEFAVVEYPARRQLVEALSEAIGRRRREKAAGPFGLLMHELEAAVAALARFNDPRGLYARLPFDLVLR